MNECMNKQVYARYGNINLRSKHRIQTPRRTEFSVTQFQIYVILKRAKENRSINIFEKRAAFFLARMKQRDEGGGRILLGDNTGGRAVMLLPIMFQCVEIPAFNRTALRTHA
jgi:hypothetical protein